PVGLRQPRPAREMPRRHVRRSGVDRLPRQDAPVPRDAGDAHHEMRAVLPRALQANARREMSLHPQIPTILERVARSPLPAYHTVSAHIARRIYRDTRAVLSPKPPEIAETRLLVFDNSVAVRAYRPVLDATLPALMFFHGGGWAIGDLDTHEALWRRA